MNAEVLIDETETRTLSVETMNPLMLIERAIDKGMDPAQLKALVDLQEQWTAYQAKAAYARAMTDAQEEMPLIVRDAQNTHTQSRYARLETITHWAKPVYTKHGFALSFSEAESPKPNMKRVVCKVSHRDGHSESHWVELPIDGTGAKGGKSSMNEVQGCISTNSYGHRVLTCNVFNITIADTDLDGQAPNPTPDETAPRAKPRAQRQAPPPTAVSEQQFKHVKDHWVATHPEPTGDVNTQREKFKGWVRYTAKREFNPGVLAEWSIDDYTACCRALNIESEV